MKKLYIIIIALCCLTLQTEAKKRQLVILHSNDTHSCIEPLNKNLADTMLANRGGYLRRVNMIKEQREQYPQLLLLDSGDFSQGSSYYTLFKGDVEIGLMNLMGYDAATIGNHEFDFGLENMARIFKMANFPIVCANYDFSGTPVEGIVKPYVIIKRNGIKIGIFGLSPHLDGLVSKTNYEPVKYLDPVAKAQEMATLLKKEKKCDLVICLSHLGWEATPIDDIRMIQQTEGIDLVLGGHTHTYFTQLHYVKDPSGKRVPSEQNGKHGIFIGRLFIDMESK